MQKLKELIKYYLDHQWYKPVPTDQSEPSTTYEFKIEHHPVEGTYHPILITRRWYYDYEYAPRFFLLKRIKPCAFRIYKESAEMKTIVLRSLNDWLTIMPWRGTDEKRCETREQALHAIALYKEQHFNTGVIYETIETIIK